MILHRLLKKQHYLNVHLSHKNYENLSVDISCLPF